MRLILLLDNYDSFVHILARYVRELGEQSAVHRHDAIELTDIAALDPSHIIISPGPRTPREAGISNDVVKAFAGRIPILGVCLGHQCIGEVYGATVVRAARPMHGKTSPIHHAGEGIFRGLPNPFLATRYHSLIVPRDGLPDDLEVTATSERDDEVMALRHRDLPVWGVQFHPESILTEHGYTLLRNFLALGQASEGAPP